jgi:predicted metal-dependent phosphoesterase TrpH
MSTDVLKVDLHLHTAEDPVDRMPHTAIDLVDRAAELGFDALAVTLHDCQFANARLSAHARQRGITLIPGIERTVQRRHVLLLNFPAAAAEAVHTLNDVRRLKERHPSGLVVAPHAFFPGTTCLRRALDRHADLFDAVEWSYFWLRDANFNARAARWAHDHGKPLVGNSDLHDLRQLGRTFSLVDSVRDVDAICAAIKAGRVSVQTTPVPPLELVGVFSRMLLRGRKRTGETPVPLANPLRDS